MPNQELTSDQSIEDKLKGLREKWLSTRDREMRKIIERQAKALKMSQGVFKNTNLFEVAKEIFTKTETVTPTSGD
jgi:hypothetical protein